VLGPSKLPPCAGRRRRALTAGHPGCSNSRSADSVDTSERRWPHGRPGRTAATSGFKRLGPDSTRDDFDELYRCAEHGSIVAFLATIQPPRDLTSILSRQFMWFENRFPWAGRTGTGVIEAIFACGVRWEETGPEKLRQSLLKVTDYHLQTILRHLKRPEVCSPETPQRVIRTPRIQQRLIKPRAHTKAGQRTRKAKTGTRETEGGTRAAIESI